MEEKIQKAIEYLRHISIKEPVNIRVEEVFEYSITLSYEESCSYTWEKERHYKIFNFTPETLEIVSMTMYKEVLQDSEKV